VNSLYPSIVQDASDRRGQGQSLHVEECGNPEGKGALVLRCDAGSGCTQGMRRLFNPMSIELHSAADDISLSVQADRKSFA
jgi:hypothetical protein